MFEKLACNMESCPCKRLKCERHGKWEECITHHNEKETKYEPYCMRKSSKKSKK